MNSDPTIAEAKIANMFNGIAKRYDLLNTLLSLGQDQRWRRVLVSKAPRCPNGVWVDVACGTGDILLAAAKQHSEYKRFVGVDISREMLAIAKEKCAESNRIELAKMSAVKLEFENNAVDCISIGFGLRNVIDKEAALQEFYRVLRPAGQLFVLEFFPPKRGFLSWLFLFYFRYILPKIGGLFSNKDAYAYLPQSVQNFYTATELKEKLVGAGFSKFYEISFLWGSCRIIQAIKR